NRFAWRIANDLETLSRFADQFETAGRDAGIPPAILLRLTLVVEEVVTNAIKYGYDAGAVGRIDIILRVAPDQAEVIIADDAKPFDPTTIPAADVDAAMDNRPVGGLGIHLIRSFSDTLEYRPQAHGNLLRLVHRFVKSPAA
ncbi:MAG: ATP-binding protein, partial [Gammaproteobacteria bacterium]|nr:ATP-binding protein [Gammaproteobacteria bacterium]